MDNFYYPNLIILTDNFAAIQVLQAPSHNRPDYRHTAQAILLDKAAQHQLIYVVKVSRVTIQKDDNFATRAREER